MGDEHFPTRHRRARKPHRCVECYRTIAPGDTYARFAGVGDGSAWSEPMCLACEGLTTFVWDRVRAMGLREDLGPSFGRCATWLEEDGKPCDIAATMQPATAGHFLGLLFAVNERTENERERRRVSRLNARRLQT